MSQPLLPLAAWRSKIRCGATKFQKSKPPLRKAEDCPSYPLILRPSFKTRRGHSTQLLATLRADGGSFFRRLTKRHRQAQAKLRALCKGQPPKKAQDQIALLEKLHEAQATRR